MPLQQKYFTEQVRYQCLQLPQPPEPHPFVEGYGEIPLLPAKRDQS